MRIGIYSPYLDTVGGGERYMLTIAQILAPDNQIDILLDSHLQTLDINEIKGRVTRILDISLSGMDFVNAPLGKGGDGFKRLSFLKKYDLLFYLTDGSIFFSTAKKNILHIQSPIKITKNSLIRKLKQSSWDLVIYNSEFTKKACEKYWKIPGLVVYPPIDIKDFKSAKPKTKQIISVGRFFGYLRDKKQDLMIKVFKKIVDLKKAQGWSLHLVGGAQEGDSEYVNELKELAKGYPIEISPNLAFKDLKNEYAKSAIYWHAAGFGETDPEKMEHFGITTVEAMAAGCVPVVINLGGQKEIVKDGENGFLWDTPEDFERKTVDLINNPGKLEKISKSASGMVAKFSTERFIEDINNIILN